MRRATAAYALTALLVGLMLVVCFGALAAACRRHPTAPEKPGPECRVEDGCTPNPPPVP